MELYYLILLLLGLAAGLLAGLFGIGGGILFTPILFLLFNDAGLDQPVLWTIGSSLFCTFIAAFGSSVRQYRQDNFFWVEGAKVGVLGALGVTAGKWVITSGYYTEKEFVLLFSFLFLYVAFMFFRRGKTPDAEIESDLGAVDLKMAGVAGGAGGFVAALAGIGGGGVMVPVLNLFYGQPIQKTVSVSSLAIVFISLSGVVQLALIEAPGNALSGFALGAVDLGTALPLALGGLAGGFAGAYLNLKINRRYLQYGFALLALAMSIRLIAEIY
ncbi:MAG: TSUP family transporter [Balneolaceae bacterium]|nr:TSUP family transporter [Balneolaceae bacterium]